MSALDTLKAHLDAAWEQITESDRFLELMREAGVAFRANEAMPREYLRLGSLTARIFETSALMSDDDIAELTATIANEKDEKMAEYKLPDEPEGPVWDKNGTEFHKVKAVSFTDRTEWTFGPYKVVYSWRDLVYVFGPLTDTPPIKEGDTGLTAEQVWDLPKGTVIWPERDGVPEPWMRFSNRWESVSEVSYSAGELQCLCGDSFRVLILGGGE